MFTRELESRRHKFEQESLNARRNEKQKSERLMKERIAARMRAEKTENKKRERLLDHERQKQEEEDRLERLRHRNRGIVFETVLTPGPLSEERPACLGIKRYKDKVVLPRSMSRELMKQKAYTNGGLLFELKADNGRCTHVGVLDFSAEEGFIYLPPHVQRCLTSEEGKPSNEVKVVYERLLDGTFATFQPLKHGFHEEVGENMRDVLENTLSQYSTLTEGDIVRVRLESSGVEYDIKVVELAPASAVRILQTDLEVDVLPSAEVEEAVRNRLASDPFQFSNSGHNRLQKHKITKRPSEPENQTPVPREAGITREALAQRLRAMDPEPSENREDVIVCSIRLPTDLTFTRRFLLDDTISHLFRIVEQLEADAIGRHTSFIQFATQFPRRVITKEEHGEQTFRGMGFAQREALFVEAVDIASSAL